MLIVCSLKLDLFSLIFRCYIRSKAWPKGLSMLESAMIRVCVLVGSLTFSSIFQLTGFVG